MKSSGSVCRYAVANFGNLYKFLFAIGVSCQDIPDAKVCVSQAAANACRDNAIELPLQKEKVKTLEEALKLKDVSIEELKALNDQNIKDLTKRLQELMTELSFTKGQLSKAETQILWQIEIIKGLVPKLRKKCVIAVLFC